MIKNIHFQKYCELIFIFLLAYIAKVISFSTKQNKTKQNKTKTTTTKIPITVSMQALWKVGYSVLIIPLSGANYYW